MFYIAIHHSHGALCVLHRQSLTPQLSVSQAETLNKQRIMARPLGIQKRDKKKKKRTREREEERARGEMTATGWQSIVCTCPTLQYFHIFHLLCSVPEGHFGLAVYANYCSSYLSYFRYSKSQTDNVYTSSLVVQWGRKATRLCCEGRRLVLKVWSLICMTGPRWTSNISVHFWRRKTWTGKYQPPLTTWPFVSVLYIL